MNQVSKKVMDALFKTLNGDENINVRLAGLRHQPCHYFAGWLSRYSLLSNEQIL